MNQILHIKMLKYNWKYWKLLDIFYHFQCRQWQPPPPPLQAPWKAYTISYLHVKSKEKIYIRPYTVSYLHVKSKEKKYIIPIGYIIYVLDSYFLSTFHNIYGYKSLRAGYQKRCWHGFLSDCRSSSYLQVYLWVVTRMHQAILRSDSWAHQPGLTHLSLVCSPGPSVVLCVHYQ